MARGMCYAIASRNMYKNHLHGRRGSQAVSAPNKYTTNTTKGDIHHLMPNHSDLNGVSELHAQ